MCQSCYDKLVEKKCGVCRIPMLNPGRNRIAEKGIENQRIGCVSSGCDWMGNYCELQKHLDCDCLDKKIVCKYKTLGCKWEGLRKNHDKHNHNIDFGWLVQHIKELKEENVDLQQNYDDEYHENEEFKFLIFNSNISETFSFQSIWQDFRVLKSMRIHDTYAPANYVLRFCGDNKKGLQIILYFAIRSPADYYSGRVIKCKVAIKTCQDINIRRQLRVGIEYTKAGIHSNGIYGAGLFEIKDQVSSLPCYSDWEDIIFIPGEQCLKKINDIILNKDVGNIKIFAKI